jgi:hypothetical protein
MNLIGDPGYLSEAAAEAELAQTENAAIKKIIDAIALKHRFFIIIPPCIYYLNLPPI